MTVVELRDLLSKLVEEGHGGKEVMVMNSPDDGLSDDWEPLSDAFLADDALNLI